jgi:hypothetical protein
MPNLAGKTALVTGASRGMGRASAGILEEGDVRFGSKADMNRSNRDVRFTPKSRTLPGNSWMSALCH